MRKFLLASLISLFSTSASAGEAENISACVKKAKEFANKNLDAFNVKYEGNIVSMSKAQWPNAYCEVKLGDVYTLLIDGSTYIYNGFAGKDSYELNEKLQAKSDEAVRQMRSRISLLEQRASQVSVSLKKPKPNHKWLTQYIDEGINKSLGNNPQISNLKNSTSPSNTKLVKESEEVITKSPSNPNEAISEKSGNSSLINQETLIPRSMSGDQGKYYLMEAFKNGDVIQTLHKRIGVDATGYTKLEINCQSKQYRDLGYSEVSPSDIKKRIGNWTDLISGSSKSDLVNFVCDL